MQSLGGVMGNRFIRSIKRRLANDEPVELLGGQRAAAYEVASQIFRHLKQHAQQAEVLRKREMSDCVVTIPVTFSGPQRKAIRRAVEHAGMNLTGILHEPFAAMISHFYDPEQKLATLGDHRILVFDWGAEHWTSALSRYRGTAQRLLSLPTMELKTELEMISIIASWRVFAPLF
jgi:Hsp70 protein